MILPDPATGLFLNLRFFCCAVVKVRLQPNPEDDTEKFFRKFQQRIPFELRLAYFFFVNPLPECLTRMSCMLFPPDEFPHPFDLESASAFLLLLAP